MTTDDSGTRVQCGRGAKGIFKVKMDEVPGKVAEVNRAISPDWGVGMGVGQTEGARRGFTKKAVRPPAQLHL